jgi:hypothetical protein
MKTNPIADEGVYDLVPDEGPPPPRVPLPPAALSYRAPREEIPAPDDPETIKNLHFPLWLLGAGVAVQVVGAWIRYRQFDIALTSVGLGLILGTALMLAGILLAARFRGIDLGNFWTAVLKLAAISVAPGALVLICAPALHFIPLGFLIGWAIEFVLYFALLGALFDLDESDTWYCVWVIFLVRLAVYFAMLGIMSGFFN